MKRGEEVTLTPNENVMFNGTRFLTHKVILSLCRSFDVYGTKVTQRGVIIKYIRVLLWYFRICGPDNFLLCT